MFGLINLNKPPGISSRKAVDHVQRLARPAKVGHAGTLDPLAEGVLVVTLGPGTRLTAHIQTWPKSYRGTFLLGRSSPTEDIEGAVVELSDAPVPELDQLQDALPRFTGTILQRPPNYSALKVGGRRAYRLARRGESVSLEARQVTIHQLQIVRYAYPELVIDVSCGSGTYLRSLGRDLARAVGTEAIMSALTRTAVGHLTLETAVLPEQLEPHTWQQHVLPAREAVRDLPCVPLTADQLGELAHGREIRLPGHGADELAAISSSGELASVLTRVTADRYRPRINFLHVPSGVQSVSGDR